MKIRYSIAFSLFALAAANPTVYAAESPYPDRPIRLIVPFAPGGGTDIVARPIAQYLTESFGKPVIVENRAGGGGGIGHEALVRSAPDGYTMMVTSTSYASNAALFKQKYDPIKDVAAITMFCESGFMVTVHPSVPVRTTPQLIALAKSRPGALNYASTGTGGVTHLATELFNLTAGTVMTHIPYKGTGAALSDLLSGQVQLIVGGMANMVNMHKAGRLRGIAVTTENRVPAVPEVPTVSEQFPGFIAVLWFGAVGPGKVPANIINRWSVDINKALAQPAMRERLAAEGYVTVGGSPESFANVIARDIEQWTRVVREAKVKAEQ